MRESDGDILFMPIESFNQIDDVKDDALHQIVFHTPLIDPHKLKKIDGVYLPAFFLGVSSLWLYYPNLSASNTTEILTTFTCTLLANFITTFNVAVDFFQSLRSKRLPKEIMEYLVPEECMKTPFVIISALLTAIPSGSAALQTGSETGTLRAIKFLVTTVDNGTINTISMRLIWDIYLLRIFLSAPIILPYYAVKRTKSLVCPSPADRIQQLKNQLKGNYDFLRNCLVNRMKMAQEKILGLEEKELKTIYSQLQTDPKNLIIILKNLLGDPLEEKILHQAKKPAENCLSTSRRLLGNFFQNQFAKFLFLSGVLAGIVTEVGDIGFTVQTSNDFASDMNLKDQSGTAFKSIFCISSLVPFTITTCYFCGDSLRNVGSFIGNLISPEPIKNIAWRFYPKVNILLSALCMYVGFYSSAAGLNMAKQIVYSDWVKEHFDEHWDFIKELILIITNYGIKIFNTYNLFGLLNDAIKKYAIQYGNDEAKICATLDDFWSRIIQQYEKIQGPKFIKALDLLKEDVEVFLGITLEDYTYRKSEIARIEQEITNTSSNVQNRWGTFSQKRRRSPYAQISSSESVLMHEFQS